MYGDYVICNSIGLYVAAISYAYMLPKIPEIVVINCLVVQLAYETSLKQHSSYRLTTAEFKL